jgi:hypothetical protein
MVVECQALISRYCQATLSRSVPFASSSSDGSPGQASRPQTLLRPPAPSSGSQGDLPTSHGLSLRSGAHAPTLDVCQALLRSSRVLATQRNALRLHPLIVVSVSDPLHVTRYSPPLAVTVTRVRCFFLSKVDSVDTHLYCAGGNALLWSHLSGQEKPAFI